MGQGCISGGLRASVAKAMPNMGIKVAGLLMQFGSGNGQGNAQVKVVSVVEKGQGC